MNKTLRNLTMSAAALAALATAPKVGAEDLRGWHEHGGHFRHHEWHRHPFPEHARVMYRMPPFRVTSGVRFYGYRPGPRYVYVSGYGWCLPPYLGAVWVPPHRDVRGFWVAGFWR